MVDNTRYYIEVPIRSIFGSSGWMDNSNGPSFKPNFPDFVLKAVFADNAQKQKKFTKTFNINKGLKANTDFRTFFNEEDKIVEARKDRGFHFLEAIPQKAEIDEWLNLKQLMTTVEGLYYVSDKNIGFETMALSLFSIAKALSEIEPDNHVTREFLENTIPIAFDYLTSNSANYVNESSENPRNRLEKILYAILPKTEARLKDELTKILAIVANPNLFVQTIREGYQTYLDEYYRSNSKDANKVTEPDLNQVTEALAERKKYENLYRILKRKTENHIRKEHVDQKPVDNFLILFAMEAVKKETRKKFGCLFSWLNIFISSKREKPSVLIDNDVTDDNTDIDALKQRNKSLPKLLAKLAGVGYKKVIFDIDYTDMEFPLSDLKSQILAVSDFDANTLNDDINAFFNPKNKNTSFLDFLQLTPGQKLAIKQESYEPYSQAPELLNNLKFMALQNGVNIEFKDVEADDFKSDTVVFNSSYDDKPSSPKPVIITTSYIPYNPYEKELNVEGMADEVKPIGGDNKDTISMYFFAPWIAKDIMFDLGQDIQAGTSFTIANYQGLTDEYYRTVRTEGFKDYNSSNSTADLCHMVFYKPDEGDDDMMWIEDPDPAGVVTLG